MTKERLNLRVDAEALERGREYAIRHETSLSRLVSEFLASLPADETPMTDLSPTVRRRLGVASGPADREAWRRHPEEKYGGEAAGRCERGARRAPGPGPLGGRGRRVAHRDRTRPCGGIPGRAHRYDGAFHRLAQPGSTKRGEGGDGSARDLRDRARRQGGPGSGGGAARPGFRGRRAGRMRAAYGRGRDRHAQRNGLQRGGSRLRAPVPFWHGSERRRGGPSRQAVAGSGRAYGRDPVDA